ncbi:MAG: hypothetical protein WDO24_09165 [Pseudomonadota bacterium]
MTKSWAIGLTAFAMMTGAALAQSSSTTTSTTVAPSVGVTSSTKSQSTDSYGTQVDKSQTYSTGNGASTNSSSKTVTSPAIAPYSDTTTRSTTTTVK